MWFGGKQKQIPRHALAASRLLTARNDNGEGFEMPQSPRWALPFHNTKMSPQTRAVAMSGGANPSGSRRCYETRRSFRANRNPCRSFLRISRGNGGIVPDVYLAADWICE